MLTKRMADNPFLFDFREQLLNQRNHQLPRRIGFACMGMFVAVHRNSQRRRFLICRKS